MNNYNYVKKLIDNNDVIMLDTSVAMSDQFEALVEEMEMLLLENKRKVIVINAVWAELLRHLGSSNKDKRKKATKAVEIIGLRQNIFGIDEDGTTSENILRAFADAEFIANIILAKAKYRQALLTNDMKLSRDVSKLNNQESCFGKEISVYNLNSYGNLVLNEERERVIQEEREVRVYEETNKESNKNIWISVIGASAASLIAGVTIGRYGKQIMKMVKAIA
jgi:hypothetical protein